MAKIPQIKWKKGDYVALGRAVSSFNKKLEKYSDESTELYFPENVNYQDLKEMITSRKELNRIINDLKRFDEENSRLITLESGEQLTKWEYQSLKKSRRIAEKRIEKELQEIKQEEEDLGFGMPSEQQQLLKAQLNSMRNLENKTGANFRRGIQQINRLGKTDYELYRAEIYQTNYLQVIEKYKVYDGYNDLLEILNKFRNPLDFYNFIKNVDELTKDLTYQSDQVFSQEEFYNWLKIIEGKYYNM